MGWKRKQKELTLEEAIMYAKRDLAPYWHGSPPLIAPVLDENGRLTLRPLEATFPKRNWMIFFIDPTELLSFAALNYALEWHRRFKDFQMEFLFILRPCYAGYGSRRAIEDWVNRNKIGFTVALDHTGMISAAFGADVFPKFVLFAQGNIAVESHGPSFFEGLEHQFHQYLRAKDPGLPLARFYKPKLKPLLETHRLEFGKKLAQRASAGLAFELTGNWQQDENKIITRDASATIKFNCPVEFLSIVAQSAVQDYAVPAKLVVRVHDLPAFEAQTGEDIRFDDEGNSCVRVGTEQIYHALANLPERGLPISLKFPDADRAGIALYGLRFGERGK